MARPGLELLEGPRNPQSGNRLPQVGSGKLRLPGSNDCRPRPRPGECPPDGTVTEVTSVRQTYRVTLHQVRAFYLDLAQWATEDPSRWAQWAVPCPISAAEVSLKKTFARRKARMDQRTRDLRPFLPQLVAAAEKRTQDARARLDAAPPAVRSARLAPPPQRATPCATAAPDRPHQHHRHHATPIKPPTQVTPAPQVTSQWLPKMSLELATYAKGKTTVFRKIGPARKHRRRAASASTRGPRIGTTRQHRPTSRRRCPGDDGPARLRSTRGIAPVGGVPASPPDHLCQIDIRVGTLQRRIVA